MMVDENQQEQCIICSSNDQPGELVRLPCGQCNHQQIENRKFIHRFCFREYLEQQKCDNDEQIVISDTSGIYINTDNTVVPPFRCPYCNTRSIVVTHSFNLTKTILKFLDNDAKYLIHLFYTLFFIFYGCYIFCYQLPPEGSIFEHDPYLYKLFFIALIGFNASLLDRARLVVFRELDGLTPRLYYRVKISFG